MYELKNNTQQNVLVRLTDSNGAPVTGVVAGSLTGAYWKADGSTGALTLAGNWTELAGGAWAGAGAYQLTLPAALLSVNGAFGFTVKHNTGVSQQYYGQAKVVANEEADTKAVVDAIRTDYSTARAAKIDNLDAAISTRAAGSAVSSIQIDVANIATTSTLLQKYAEGRQKIHKTGVDANRLVKYDTDGTTPLKKWDMKDASGNPTSTNPYDIVPV